MAGRLEGNIVLITGGGSGIGRVSALAFAREGAKVVVADVDTGGGEESVRLLKEAGAEAIFVKCDVSQAQEVQRLVEKTVSAYGRLDCAFNNAAVTELTNNAAADCSEEGWDWVIGVNLTGVWLCMKYEIRQMLQQGSGAIVNAASALGLVANGNAAYTASKHGVVGLTKSAAISYAQAGIRVNAVCPGYIATPMTAPIYTGKPQVEAELIARHPIGRLGQPEEIAEAVVWLCSPAASFVTGLAMAVDGGYVAR